MTTDQQIKRLEEATALLVEIVKTQSTILNKHKKRISELEERVHELETVASNIFTYKI